MNHYHQTFASYSQRKTLFSLTLIVLLTLTGTVRSAVADEEEVVPAPPKSASQPDKLWQDRPLTSLKATVQRTEGELPQNFAAERMTDASWIQQSGDEGRPWVLTSYEWDAPGTSHLPLFFEEPNLERMGYRENCFGCFEGDDYYKTPGCLQPLWSGAHFLTCFVGLPYQCGYTPPCQPISTLGVDRPGSPVCYRRHTVPWSCRGAAYQAGIATGLVFILP